MRLVFLNGWAASSAMLDDFIAQLPFHYELYILDDLYQFELAEIVSRIDELMTSDTVLMGWSLGGMLALYYANLSTKKHKPKALVLFNSAACFLSRIDFTEGVKCAEFDGLKVVVKQKDTKALLRLFSHLLVAGSPGHKDDRRLLKRVFNSEALPSWSVLAKGLDYLENLDLRAILGSIDQPTLFVLGEKDALISVSSNLNLLIRDNFDVDVVSGMGHFPFGVYAEKVTSIIAGYLSSISETKC
ncbi:MAG: pimeloyl-[acyl-carrier protein] methyl ester esterase [Oleiphilaceae bacterium]|jgi:pimeloyl-[acyl-carrier protein] methyl ester esterase